MFLKSEFHNFLKQKNILKGLLFEDYHMKL